MLLRIIVLCALATTSLIAQVDFTARVVADSLHIPWDMLEGPDGKIWYTERVGLVSSVDPDTREVDTLFDMRNGILNMVEVGLLSMVLHPDFADTPYVYLSYVYRDTYEWVKHVSRYRYDGKTFVDENVIYELRPAELWHQGCRMVILPDRTLLFTNGDQPAPDSTYSPTSDIGKILRINLDGSIPADNPYPNSRVWSRGHRNPQGLCMLPNGYVYSSEHGDKIEDEINLIMKDGNYGWPKVEGKCDTPKELEFCAANNVIEPVWSSGTILTYAPAGLEYYGHTKYPDLQGKLISTHLKTSRIMVHTLSDDQRSFADTKHLLEYRYGRLRDVHVHRDGRVFVCTGNAGYKNIEPFPTSTDDRIIELVPVWEQRKPIVQNQFDTIVYRTNVGDTVRAFVPFCGTTSSIVRYLDFQTTPGNIFQQRHWQDAATTEGTNCWPFKVLYIPDDNYPHVAQATAWYDNFSGGRDSSSSILIGLPYRGMLYARQNLYDCLSRTSVCSYSIELENIGDSVVQMIDVVSNPSGIIVSDSNILPQNLQPGQRTTISLRVDSTQGRSQEHVVRFVTNGLKDPSVVLRTTFAPDTTSPVVDTERGIFPFPVTNELVLRGMPKGDVVIKVFDLHGRLVYTTSTVSTGTIRIPTSAFVTTSDQFGAYAISIEHALEQYRYLFIVVQ